MGKLKRTRLKKVALMPGQMFQSQLDQISDKGRDVLKALEEYKFFVDQTARVMKNDPALTEVIVGKKKNLEEASNKIYDVVFDIENLDIAALYDRQQEVTDEKPEDNESQEDKSTDDKQPEKKDSEPKEDKSETPKKEDSDKEENSDDEDSEEDKKDGEGDLSGK